MSVTRLADLNPQFMRYSPRDGNVYWTPVATLAEAQGLKFECPKCAGGRGGHMIMCWSRSAGVPDTATPGPGRWRLVGTSLEDVTLEAEPGKTRSVLMNGCGWHGYVTRGMVTDA